MDKTLVSCTFAVSDVETATGPLREVPYREAVASFLRGPVESCSRYRGKLVADVVWHPLIAALQGAFTSHRPLTLSPDIIWLTITQGLAIHINENAERLRHRFVSHDGKRCLPCVPFDEGRGQTSQSIDHGHGLFKPFSG